MPVDRLPRASFHANKVLTSDVSNHLLLLVLSSSLFSKSWFPTAGAQQPISRPSDGFVCFKPLKDLGAGPCVRVSKYSGFFEAGDGGSPRLMQPCDCFKGLLFWLDQWGRDLRMTGISVAGGVLRLRPQRTNPSIMTIPIPGISPS